MAAEERRQPDFSQGGSEGSEKTPHDGPSPKERHYAGLWPLTSPPNRGHLALRSSGVEPGCGLGTPLRPKESPVRRCPSRVKKSRSSESGLQVVGGPSNQQCLRVQRRDR